MYESQLYLILLVKVEPIFTHQRPCLLRGSPLRFPTLFLLVAVEATEHLTIVDNPEDCLAHLETLAIMPVH